jgi:hypothetical protein
MDENKAQLNLFFASFQGRISIESRCLLESIMDDEFWP